LVVHDERMHSQLQLGVVLVVRLGGLH
jgi:hypothetical protein